MVYEQSDQVAGSGSHGGYLTILHKNKDESYVKFEGTNKMAVKEGGTWEVSSEGKLQFTGGTGKFKNIKGTGNYKGKTTEKGLIVSWEATIEY